MRSYTVRYAAVTRRGEAVGLLIAIDEAVSSRFFCLLSSKFDTSGATNDTALFCMALILVTPSAS